MEDHQATRDALVLALSEVVELVAVFSTGEAFLTSPERGIVDVALIDLGLPGASGCDVIRLIAQQSPAVRTIALTVFDDEQSVLDALSAGAHGFMLKDEPTPVLVRAIEDVHAGRRPLSSSITRHLIDQALRFAPRVQLTEREMHVAVALADGASYVECGAQLGIAVGTVQDHVKRIYRKLDVCSKRELRLWLTQHAPS